MDVTRYKYTDMTTSDLMNQNDLELGAILMERAFQNISDQAHRDAAASALRDAEDNFVSARSREQESAKRLIEVETVINVRVGSEVTT